MNVIDTGLTGYGTVSGYQIPFPTYNPTYNQGYALTLEFEPHFDYAIGDGLNFSAGLPVTYSLTPVTTVSGDSLPLMGMNSNATNSLVLQFKVYAKF